MSSTHLPWSALERVAAKHLRQPLAPYLRLARRAQSLVAKAVEVSTPLSLGQAAQVQARLMVQASLQLRVAAIAAERGYSLQAVAAGATVYELAGAVGFMRGSDERARQWLAHNDQRQSYPTARQRRSAVLALLQTSGVTGKALDDAVTDLEGEYRFYCMAKHGNPVALRDHALVATPSHLKLFHGPVGDAVSISLAQSVLSVCSIMVMNASGAFVLPHIDMLPKDRSRVFVRALKEFVSRAAVIPRPNVGIAR